MIGNCPKCSEHDVVLTKDHIIPKSIYKRFPMGQLRAVGFKKRFTKHVNIQYICSRCNSQKNNKIDCSTEYGREFWTKFKEAIEVELVLNETTPTNP